METTFFIYNMATGQVTVEAPTSEQIEHSFNYHDSHIKKRGPEQVICEVPKVFGLNLHTYRNFPVSMIMDGVALYARNKAARRASLRA